MPLQTHEDVVSAILALLRERRVPLVEVYDVLNEVLTRNNEEGWVAVPISLPLLYSLKDTIWFNLECANPQETLHPLTTLGSRLPQLAKLALEDVYVEVEDVQPLQAELNEVLDAWSEQFVLLSIKTAERLAMHQARATLQVKRVQQQEQTDLLYNTARPFHDVLGTQGTKPKDNVLTAHSFGQVGQMQVGPLFYNLLLNLREATADAQREGKGLRLDLGAYEY